MVKKENIKPSLNKLVGVTSKDSTTESNNSLSYTSGRLVEITDDAIVLLDRWGRRILITIDSIVKIKEKEKVRK